MRATFLQPIAELGLVTWLVSLRMLSLVLRALLSCALGLAIANFSRFSNLVAIFSLSLSLFALFRVYRKHFWYQTRCYSVWISLIKKIMIKRSLVIRMSHLFICHENIFLRSLNDDAHYYCWISLKKMILFMIFSNICVKDWLFSSR